MKEKNINILISDHVAEGKRSLDNLRLFDKKELLSEFIKSLSIGEQWELITDADHKDLIPELFADMINGLVTEGYFINKLIENSWSFCEELLEEMFETEVAKQRLEKESNALRRPFYTENKGGC